jgi:hypothetical protein
VPDNAARKKRAHMLSHAMGVPYTAARRALDSGSSPAAAFLMGPGDAFRRFGRPVGVITYPDLPWPMLDGTDGRGDQLTGIRLRYGSRHRTDALMLTDCPLPGKEPYAFLLTNGFHNFVARHLRDRGIVREPDRHISVLMEAAPRETVGVMLDGALVTAVRIRAEGCEGIEMPYAGGSIVYCGQEGTSDDVRFGLDRPPRETSDHPAAG